MPDDRDADVGPAGDREGPFSRSPAPHQPKPADGATWPSGTEDTDAPGAEPERPSTPSRGSVLSFFRELPVLLVVAFLLAFLLRTFVLQVFYIPSGSMEPTLQIDDRMVVEKLTYRFREPARGEIVVFEGDSFGAVPPDVSGVQRVVRGVGQFLGVVPASARDLVKRVIGVPGDEIAIVGGEVRVNGRLLDEPYVVYEDPSDFGPVTVPEGHLFFLGDNRPNSSDSRRSLGFVPRDAVVGRSVAVIWPFEHAGTLTGVEHAHVDDATPAPGGDATDDEPDAADAAAAIWAAAEAA